MLRSQGPSLSGKQAIVTGASSGLGIETTCALAGAEVAMAVRHLKAGEEAAATLRANPSARGGRHFSASRRSSPAPRQAWASKPPARSRGDGRTPFESGGRSGRHAARESLRSRGPSLFGKQAIITGVSSGLGIETTCALAGAEVVMAATLRANLPAGKGKLGVKPLDLTDLASVRRFTKAWLASGFAHQQRGREGDA